MANTIKLKRGSGSDPSASDLAVGEVAVRTDEGKLFTKKDDGSVAEISGSNSNDKLYNRRYIWSSLQRNGSRSYNYK
jgi:hypothetical protein